jgi:hypothetical protein
MGKAEKAALQRLGRNTLSLLISGATAYLTDKPYLIAMAPLISSVAKWLRDKLGLKNCPV